MQPVIVRVAAWERYGWLRAGFSTRFAGISDVYGEGELNLGWTREDTPNLVRRNRAAFVHAVTDGFELPMVTVGQIHSAVVRDLEAESGPLRTPEGRAALEGDGLVSLRPGRLLAVLTADCVPVLVADTRTHAVGAFHAGWRGTLGGVVQRGVTLMQERYETRAEDVVAAIGPCIRACCFEVGVEVREAFLEQWGSSAAELFQPSAADAHKFRMDLVEANRRQLTAAGVPAPAVEVAGTCTACTRRDEDGRRRYYSYRAENGRCGRMLSAICAMA